MSVDLIPVIDLPFLAREINDAHRQVTFHAKGMLLEAKRAGEALLQAKKECKHGEFKAWVEGNTSVSYSSASDYMKVARHWQKLGVPDFSGSIRAALAQIENPKPQPSTNPFTQDDAEFALKIHARAERGMDGEREVARGKLEKLAKEHGFTSEELVEKAKGLVPDHERAKGDIAREKTEAKLKDAEQRLREMEEKLTRIDNLRLDLMVKLKDASRDKLFEHLAVAYARLEELGEKVM